MIGCECRDRRSEGETVLRQCQLVQLRLLHIVDAISRKVNIPYFLVGGSLLGAMRHDGFIPWDDDLDIGVPYSQYKRFLLALRKYLPQDVFLQEPSNYKNTAICFAKIRDLNSFYYECRADVATSDPSGIFLDIFPYEDMPEIGRGLQKFLVKAIGSAFSRDVWLRNYARKGFIVGTPCLLMAVALRMLRRGLRALLIVLKVVFPSRTVYNVCELGLEYAFKKDDIYPLTQHKFEDGEFPVPGNADAVLTTQYGNWREIPPPDKRPRHARIIDPFHSGRS